MHSICNVTYIVTSKTTNDIWLLLRFTFLVLDTVHFFLEKMLQHLFSTGDKITVTPAWSGEESWCDLSSMCHVMPSTALCSAKNEKLRKRLFSPCTPKGTSLFPYSVNTLKDHKILIHFSLWKTMILAFLILSCSFYGWSLGWRVILSTRAFKVVSTAECQ